MKTTCIGLALLLLPSVSFAAALTQDQANSLISVVQSSTSTPAVAFVPLITAFSNITVDQATRLIEVVQAAPGVPANAFVNLLISFTVDQITFVAPIVPVTPPATTSPVLGTVTPPITPVQPVLPNVKLEVTASNCDDFSCYPSASTTVRDMYRFTVKTTKDGIYTKLPVTVTTNDPDLPSQFQINAPDQIGWFCVAPSYLDFPNHGCQTENPVSKGTYEFTFSMNDYSFASVTKTVEVK